MFNKAGLGCRSTALHTIDYHHIRTGMHCQLHIIKGTSCADFNVNRFFPVGDLTQFLNLDRQIIRASPIGMTASRTLVNAFG